MMKYYETVREAICDLAKRGYTTDFKILTNQDCLVCHQTVTQLSPDDFVIDETHRFEGYNYPGDEMIVHAISSKKYNMKGVVVNGYGIYADTNTSKVVAHL